MRRTVVILSIFVYAIRCAIDHLSLLQFILLCSLLCALIFLRVDFALRSSPCQNVDVIDLNLRWLVLDS